MLKAVYRGNDFCQRKLSAKEINRNFGRDTSFGVFEWSVENEVWERLSLEVTV